MNIEHSTSNIEVEKRKTLHSFDVGCSMFDVGRSAAKPQLLPGEVPVEA